MVDGFVKKLRRQVICLLLFVFYSSLLFVMRVVVCSFVRDIQKVTSTIILVMLVLAVLELTTMVNLESAVVEFSPLSHRYVFVMQFHLLVPDILDFSSCNFLDFGNNPRLKRLND